MMNIDSDWLTYLLLASNALLAGSAVLAILRAERMTRQQNSFWKSPTGAALSMQPNHDELLKAINGRINALVKQLDSPREDADKDSQAVRSMPFENAVRMARHGATLQDLTRTCGLSDSEAHLLMRVHGRQAQIAQAS